MSANSFPVDVSRETFDKLAVYHDLVVRWNKTINLVSKSSIEALWDRHIWDSAQIANLVEHATTWVDIGSGGGFPALVVSIIHAEHRKNCHMTMIESDTRKATFLRTVVRELNLNATVIAKRIEAVDPQSADVVSARALADLVDLLPFATRHLVPGGTALFMKGASWEKEVQNASESWSFDLRAHKSITNPAAAILELKEIKRV